jgi:hypothetical protein
MQCLTPLNFKLESSVLLWCYSRVSHANDKRIRIRGLRNTKVGKGAYSSFRKSHHPRDTLSHVIRYIFHSNDTYVFVSQFSWRDNTWMQFAVTFPSRNEKSLVLSSLLYPHLESQNEWLEDSALSFYIQSFFCDLCVSLRYFASLNQGEKDTTRKTRKRIKVRFEKIYSWWLFFFFIFTATWYSDSETIDSTDDIPRVIKLMK